jgi:hypothetical protein
VEQPLVSGIILLVTLLLYGLNGALRDRIADSARCAWFMGSLNPGQVEVKRSIWSFIARPLRTSTTASVFAAWVSRYLLPALALICIALAAVVVVERTILTNRTGTGVFCRRSEPHEPRPPPKAR